MCWRCVVGLLRLGWVEVFSPWQPLYTLVRPHQIGYQSTTPEFNDISNTLSAIREVYGPYSHNLIQFKYNFSYNLFFSAAPFMICPVHFLQVYLYFLFFSGYMMQVLQTHCPDNALLPLSISSALRLNPRNVTAVSEQNTVSAVAVACVQ